MIVTGAGSLPGEDFRGALAAMAEALPELLPLPELPARGPSSQMDGRALGLIDGLAFDQQTHRWRLTDHSDHGHRAARAQWRRDLDDAEELLQDFAGTLKVGIAGPWTLAACVERPRGDLVLADHGARRELAEALREGVDALAGELARRLPQVDVVWQIDEPGLLAVREGSIPTASGFSRHRAVDLPELVGALQPFADDAVLHCCAAGVWLDIARRAGFARAYLPATDVDIDALGSFVDGEGSVVLGVVDTNAREVPGTDRIVDAARRVTRELGVGEWLTLAPDCGLAGWGRRTVLPLFGRLREASGLLDQDRR